MAGHAAPEGTDRIISGALPQHPAGLQAVDQPAHRRLVVGAELPDQGVGVQGSVRELGHPVHQPLGPLEPDPHLGHTALGHHLVSGQAGDPQAFRGQPGSRPGRIGRGSRFHLAVQAVSDMSVAAQHEHGVQQQQDTSTEVSCSTPPRAASSLPAASLNS